MSMPVKAREFRSEELGAGLARNFGLPRPHARSAYLVSLAALRVTCGVSHGDRLHTAADLIVGDVFRSTRPAEAIAVRIEAISDALSRVHFENADIGSRQKTLIHVETLTLMSEHGDVRTATVICDAHSAEPDHFLLLDDPLGTKSEYHIILKD